MHKKLAFLIVSLQLISSCGQSLDEIPASNEIVNRFNVSWRADVSPEKKKVIREILENMQYVKGGTYIMGATQEQEPYAHKNERPAHFVQLSDYYICKYELTIDQLSTLTDKKFSSYENTVGSPKYTIDDYLYIVNLIKTITDIEFDLPTEAQWEYAARGGPNMQGKVYPGSNIQGENKMNELGLFDMELGKSELCKDAYTTYRNDFSLEINPCNLQGRGHVIRGGNGNSRKDKINYHESDMFLSLYDDKRACRVSARSYVDDEQLSYLYNNVSCRLVINLSK